ncbi:MAG TPA: hypothetical protein VKD70_10775 [Candidatus Acidoferrum sp.]|nr:hypothetical protein [Candidatus Acidoferrum sp.]
MRNKLRKHRRRRSFWDSVLFLLGVAFAFLLASELHNRGIPLKWGTATAGTIITFGFVIYACREMLSRWAFWVSLVICFGAHLIMVWAFFQLLLSSFERFSILLWYPFMLLEVIALLIAIKRIHDKLTGTRETFALKM